MPKLKTTIEIEIEVEFDYQKGENPTWNYPGCKEDIDITDVKTPKREGKHFNLPWMMEVGILDDEIEDLIWANRDSWEED